jgi:hypothetical protein
MKGKRCWEDDLDTKEKRTGFMESQHRIHTQPLAMENETGKGFN